jgi:hypothetical protein
MMPIYAREELKALRDEFRTEYRLRRDETRETNKVLASRIQRHTHFGDRCFYAEAAASER